MARPGGGITSANVPNDLGASGGGGATWDFSAILLAAISSGGFDSAPGPATAGACGAVAGEGSGDAVAGEGSGDAAAVAVTATGGHTLGARESGTGAGDSDAAGAGIEPLGAAGRMLSTSSGESVAATVAVSINRTCWGTGKWPYLLALYLAVQGTLAHTCKRSNFSPQSAHPVVPAGFDVVLVGSRCHLTVSVALVSSCTMKAPS